MEVNISLLNAPGASFERALAESSSIREGAGGGGEKHLANRKQACQGLPLLV